MGFNEDAEPLYTELDQFIVSAAAEDPILKRIFAGFSGGSEDKRELRNRQIMQQRISDFWIKGFLEDSLHNELLIDLGMEVNPDAVEYPWEMVIQRPDHPGIELPSGTTILDIYNQSGDSLLILGEPGSGKTTMLLELARQLIAGTQSILTQPIPVIFNLSSWAVDRLPLDEWLEEEFLIKYDIAKKISRPWIKNDDLLLLLDGLDEVAPLHQEECVRTINAFHQEHLVPLVICSRIADYEVLSTQLRVQSSVQLQPLSPSQITAYLERIGLEQSGLFTVIGSNEQLQLLARSPMMLGIMTSTIQDESVDSLLPSIESEASIEAYRKQLFDLYVTRMFGRRSPATHFSPDHTTRWLSWLAQTMRQHGQTSVLAENMQSTWLPTHQQQRSYRVIVSSVGSLMFMIVTGFGLLLSFLLESIANRSDFLMYVNIILVASVVAGLNYFLNSFF